MNNTKVIEVLGMYQQRLEDMGCLPRPTSHDTHIDEHIPRRMRMLDHAYYMVLEAERFAVDNRREKAFRWLGFIQGVLWAGGVYTIGQLKDHNKP